MYLNITIYGEMASIRSCMRKEKISIKIFASVNSPKL